MPIMGYSNAIHANMDEKKSTTGLAFISGRGAVLWKSKKQSLSAQFSTEAEYIALAHVGYEARWFHNLYTELRFPLSNPIPIHCDNLGAILMIANPYSLQSS